MISFPTPEQAGLENDFNYQSLYHSWEALKIHVKRAADLAANARTIYLEAIASAESENPNDGHTVSCNESDLLKSYRIDKEDTQARLERITKDLEDSLKSLESFWQQRRTP